MEELRNFIGGQWTDSSFDERADLSLYGFEDYTRIKHVMSALD